MRIGIVGAGLMGRVLAYQALLKDWQVTLFDSDHKDGKKSCGYSAAGLLSPYAELISEESSLMHIGEQAINFWSALHETFSHCFFFQKKGTLCIAHTQDVADFTRYQQSLTIKGAKQATHWQLVMPQQLEPELNPRFQHAVYLSQEAHIDSTSLFNFFKACLEKKCSWFSAQTINELGSGYIKQGKRTWHFDVVFDCRGLGAKSSLANLRGVRGELIYLHAPDVNLQRPIRLIHPRYPIYIVPRPDHVYVIGASQIDCEDHSAISVQTTLELLTSAFSVHSGFAEARILKNVVNCRPTFAHHLPQVFYQKGLVQINGLYRHGYLYAPYIANELIKFFSHIPISNEFGIFVDEGKENANHFEWPISRN